MKILGIDHGMKRTGLAIGDSEERIAVDYGVVETSEKDDLISRIRKIIEEENVDRIVVGMPLSMNGVERERAREVKEFIRSLKLSTTLAVHIEDERLTSRQFEKIPMSERQGKSIDALAASDILQAYLDKI